MNRRHFLATASAALMAGAAIDLSNIKSINARSRRGINDVREIPINLDDNPDLKPIGGTYHLTVDDMEREILVVHSKANEYIAVDIKCRHRGCDVNYEASEKKFICPCHGSEYDLNGSVLKGPTTQPLNYYHAELKGNEVVISVYGTNDTPPARPARALDTTKVVSDTTKPSIDSTQSK